MPDPGEWDFPNAATPPGSGDYYVVRFSPQPQRNRLARWFAWFAQLDAIAARASDPGVARLKLDWWREEIGMLHQSEARHPLTQAMTGLVSHDWQVAQMLRAIDAIEQRILRRQPADMDELLAQCAARQASRLRLLCDTDEPQSGDRLEQLGGFVGAVERLQHLAADMRDHYLSLPAGLVREHGVDAQALLEDREVPRLRDLGDAVLQGMGACDSTCLSRLDREHPELRPALRRVAQSRRLARLMRRHGYASNRQRLVLSPLGLLWSAWRMR